MLKKATKTVAATMFGLCAMSLAIPQAAAEGNLVARCKGLEDLLLGTDDAGFAVSQSSYEIETGKCYKLEITSSGKHEYILQGAEFFANIWIRKLEIGNIELKPNSLHSIDFDADESLELYFLAIKPGTYKLTDRDLGDKGTEISFLIK